MPEFSVGFRNLRRYVAGSSKQKSTCYQSTMTRMRLDILFVCEITATAVHTKPFTLSAQNNTHRNARWRGRAGTARIISRPSGDNTTRESRLRIQRRQ